MHYGHHGNYEHSEHNDNNCLDGHGLCRFGPCSDINWQKMPERGADVSARDIMFAQLSHQNSIISRIVNT